MLKAVLFDLDGTLLDRERSLLRFIRHQYERFPQFLGHLPQTNYVNKFIELDGYGSVWKDQVYQQLVTEFELDPISGTMLLEDYEENFHHSCIGFAGLQEMLNTLKKEGYKLGIITNGRDLFQQKTIKALGIVEMFEVVLISEREGVRKPDREIFERGLKALGVLAEAAVFVGDNPQADIEGAQAVGLRGIWKANEHWRECATADGVFETLEELPGLIEKLGFDGICGRGKISAS